MPSGLTLSIEIGPRSVLAQSRVAASPDGAVALVLAAAQFAIAERVLPQAENALKEWWSATAPSGEASTRLWANTDRGPVSIDSVSPDGLHLRGLRLYGRNAAGLI